MKMLEPATEEQLAQAVRDATGPLKIRGGGTRPLGNPVTGEVLSTTGLSGITLYEPGALTIVAKAGTPLAEIEAALSKENQRLPFEPMDHRALLGTDGVPTIGGVVASNASGPRRIQAGACRDALIGVRFVDGTGTAIKNGGRVMKNVTGYDLVKLMAGSYGTLGVLSEVSFKLLPGIAAQATVQVSVPDAGQAVAAMSAALGSPFDVSGAAFHKVQADGAGEVCIRLEGFSDSVTYRSSQLEARLAEFGAVSVETDPEAVRALWAEIKNVTAFAGHAMVARVSLKPSSFVGFRSQISERFGFSYQLDWGGGLVWLAADEAQLVQAARSAGFEATAQDGTRAVMEMVQSCCTSQGGHASLIKGPAGHGHPHPFQPEAAPIQALNAGLRSKFDPRGLLNPGLMG